MITRRVLLGSATGLMLPLPLADVAAAAMAAQQKPASTRKPVFQHDLPDLALKGWSVTVVEVNYGPGDSSGAHRHPGITLAYVLEGEVRSKVNDGPEKTYAAGEMWIEMPNDLHAVSANASTTKPAKLLAVLMAEKGKPLTTPAAD
jgi:quercetin dioxygenase-like cupin family protein